MNWSTAIDRGIPSEPAAARQWPFASLLLALFAVILHLLPHSGALQLDRQTLLAGKIWTLFTCHFTHFSINHLAWDVIMFALLGAVCEQIDRRRMLVTLAIAAALISAGVVCLAPNITHYRGLSGLDSTLFGLLIAGMIKTALASNRRGGAWLGVAFMAAFIAKVSIEYHSGAAIFADTTAGDFVPVPLAHSVGLMCGIAGAFLPIGKK
jgi:rhomboid family GlyGly-CTERM serine protease